MDDIQSLSNFVDAQSADSDYEDALINIGQVVVNMLDENPDLLFSYLYRLDVDEHKIKNVLLEDVDQPVHKALAKLILDRQILRIKTRLEYAKQKNKDDLDLDLTW